LSHFHKRYFQFHNSSPKMSGWDTKRGNSLLENVESESKVKKRNTEAAGDETDRVWRKIPSCVPHILDQVRYEINRVRVHAQDVPGPSTKKKKDSQDSLPPKVTRLEEAQMMNPACPGITLQEPPKFVCVPPLSHNILSKLGPGTVFDSHCHLDILGNRLKIEGRNVTGVHDRLEVDGVGLGEIFAGCVANFCDPREWTRGVKFSKYLKTAEKDDKVFLSIGVHPHFADRLTSSGRLQLERLLRGDGDILRSVVAIGECGLDYSTKNTVDRELQKKVFHEQLLLGLKYNLPFVLHVREAEEDGYEVLQKAGVPDDWLIHRHCFTGGWQAASVWLKRYPSSKIGIAGCVTFRSATQIHNAVRNIPLDRMLLETDAPYFLPVGVDSNQYQYSFSQPGHLVHVAAKVAELKGLAVEKVLAANRRNVTEIYGIRLKN